VTTTGVRTVLLSVGLVVLLATAVWAQTPSAAAFVRSDDEKGLTDAQLPRQAHLRGQEPVGAARAVLLLMP